jgi:hypothetical protein
MPTDSWTRTQQVATQQEAAGGLWLKLANHGDRAVVVFLGEPYPREVVFDQGSYQPFTPAHATAGLKPTYRFPINVCVLPDAQVKVLEIGAALIRDVLAVRTKYGLAGWAYEIVRNGAAKDPKTTYKLLPERALTTDEQRRFAGLPLHDLEALYDPARRAERSMAPVPIDDPTAQDLVEHLRTLPRPAVAEWLHEMKIARVRELTTDKLAEARALIKQLAEHAKAQPADPFA